METQMLLHGAMGLTGGPWVSTGNQGGNSVASVNIGRFTHLYETIFRVSYTFFGVLGSLWVNGFGHV